MRATIILLIPLLLCVAGCGPTRFTVPANEAQVEAAVLKSGTVQQGDRIKREYSGVNKRLIISHYGEHLGMTIHDGTSVVTIQQQSDNKSDIILRSDDLGPVWTNRNRSREERLKRDIIKGIQALEREPTGGNPERDSRTGLGINP